MLLAAPETSVTGQLPDASGTEGGNGSDFFSGGVWTPAPPETVTGGGALTPMPEGLNPDASFQLDGDGTPSLSMNGSGEGLSGNEWQSAYDTGILSGVETYSGGIGGTDGIDIYRFELSESTVAGILLEGLTADLNMELYYPEDSLGWYYPKAGLQSELMQVSLDPGTYYVSIRPALPTVSGDYVLRLVFDAAPAVPSGLTLVNSPSGHATSNLTPTLSGQAQPGTHVMVLYETGHPAGEAITDSQGNWSLTTETLTEGTYSFRAVAFTNEGFYSELSAPLQITVERQLPQLVLTRPLQMTTLTGQSRLQGRVDGTGSGIAVLTYQLGNLPPVQVAVQPDGQFDQVIALEGVSGGKWPLTLRVIDGAGNQIANQFTVQIGETVQLAEGTSFLSQTSLPLVLDETSGMLSFDLEAVLDRSDSQAISGDRFLVYLVDQLNQPSQTIAGLDYGKAGTAVFALSETGAEFTPGLVQFDGKTVQIDLSRAGNRTSATLIFQLINNDGDTGTHVQVTNLVVTADTRLLPLASPAPQAVAAGGPIVDWSLYQAVEAGLSPTFSQIRFDATTGIYRTHLGSWKMG